MRDLVYRSQVDAWIALVILGAALLCGFDVGSEFVREWASPHRSTGVLTLFTGILALGVAFPIWVLVSTRYVLSRDRLDVHCGPFRWRIALRDITRVEPSRSTLSGPALSLDRLRIDYGGARSIVISPRERETFVRVLEERRRHA